jgi:hypothetical protein
MITKDEVILLLLNACPSFAGPWEALCEEDPERLLYIDLGEFARHLIGLHRSGQIAEFPAVFSEIERLHIEGDSYVKEAATIGLLEGIQNNAGHADLDPEEFVVYLRPESAKWWRQLNAFWDGRIPYVGATYLAESPDAQISGNELKQGKLTHE